MSKISKLHMRTGLLKNFIKLIKHLTLKTFEPKWSNNKKIVLQTCCSGKTTTASFSQSYVHKAKKTNTCSMRW